MMKTTKMMWFWTGGVLLSGCGLFGSPEVLDEQECTQDLLAGNGIDDDADGVIDEGCACAFEASMQGVCASGVIDARSGVCLVPDHYYAVEVLLCDGLDNNCDGLIDPGCRCEHLGSGVGVCPLGRVDAITGVCQVSPLYQEVERACDGYDNDCDGATDEECLTCPVNGSQVGACAFGLRDTQGACIPPAAYLEDESTQCAGDRLAGDGVDNDCDGVIDEGCACDFGGAVFGICSLGVRAESGCQAPAGYEIEETSCDGLDNDCDGQVDEGCARRPSPGEGCASGERRCLDGELDRARLVPAQIEVGSSFGCARMTDGDVYCWKAARLMPGDTSFSEVYRVKGMPAEAAQITVGASHGCARMARGETYCWGSNSLGQLGTGAITRREESEPFGTLFEAVEAVKVPAYIDISAGNKFTCVVDTAFDVLCWGSTEFDSLGRGEFGSYEPLEPGKVLNVERAREVDADVYGGCALLDGGEVKCWGVSGLIGIEGDPEAMGSMHHSALPVKGLVGAVKLSIRGGRGCVLNAAEELSCWGSSSNNLLLQPTQGVQFSPVKVTLPARVIDVAVGWSHTCALLKDRRVMCWGKNDEGQTGSSALTTATRCESDDPSCALTEVTGVVDAVELKTSGHHTCARQADGQVVCWGQIRHESGEIAHVGRTLPVVFP